MDLTKLEGGENCGISPDRDKSQQSISLEGSGSMDVSKPECKEASDSFLESPPKRIKLHQSIENDIGEFSSSTTVISASSDINSSSRRKSMKGTAPVKQESVFLPTYIMMIF